MQRDRSLCVDVRWVVDDVKGEKQLEALQRLREMPDVCVNPEDIAPVLGVTVQSVRKQIADGKNHYKAEHFETRSVIPRIPFIKYCTGED